MLSELEILQEKLGKLLKQYTALQADRSRLQLLQQKQDNVISRQREEIAVLKKELQVQALENTDISDMGTRKEDLKKYLDDVIEEIEKSLATLK